MNDYPDTEQIEVGLAAAADVAFLQEIELAAAATLAPYAPAHVLDETTDVEDFVDAMRDGHLWVARFGDRVVGFALVEMLADDHPHLEEVDVHPDFQHRGVGTALLKNVLARMKNSPYRQLTLTTFRDVPWNAPFYQRLGFRPMRPAELTPQLQELIEDESNRGLDASTRVAMVIAL